MPVLVEGFTPALTAVYTKGPEAAYILDLAVVCMRGRVAACMRGRAEVYTRDQEAVCTAARAAEFMPVLRAMTDITDRGDHALQASRVSSGVSRIARVDGLQYLHLQSVATGAQRRKLPESNRD
jgi:hypothetical protein